MVIVYVLYSVIFVEHVTGQSSHEKQSTAEPGVNLFLDSGYGSRVQTGSRLAKWQEMSDTLFGKYGPGRKRSVEPSIRIIDQPIGTNYDLNYAVLEFERELKNRRSFYQLKLYCLELLENFWKKYGGEATLFAELKHRLDYICS